MTGFTKKEKTIMKIIFIFSIIYIIYLGMVNKDKNKIFICKNPKTKNLYYCDKAEKEINKLDNLKIKKWY